MQEACPSLRIKNRYSSSAAARMRQEGEGADGVIAAAAPRAEQRDLSCPSIKRGKECELGIGRIFIGRKARDGHSRRLKLISIGGAERIKIAHNLVQWYAERCRVPGAAISGNHQSGIAPLGPVRIEQRRVGLIAPRKNQRAHRYLALYRAGYTCVLPSPA